MQCAIIQMLGNLIWWVFESLARGWGISSAAVRAPVMGIADQARTGDPRKAARRCVAWIQRVASARARWPNSYILEAFVIGRLFCTLSYCYVKMGDADTARKVEKMAAEVLKMMGSGGLPETDLHEIVRWLSEL